MSDVSYVHGLVYHQHQRCHEAWLVWSLPWQLGGPLDLALAPATYKATCGMELPFLHLRFTVGWLNNPEFNDGLRPSLNWFDRCRLVNLAIRVIDGYRLWREGDVGYVRRSMRSQALWWCLSAGGKDAMMCDAKCIAKPFWWSCKLRPSWGRSFSLNSISYSGWKFIVFETFLPAFGTSACLSVILAQIKTVFG